MNEHMSDKLMKSYFNDSEDDDMDARTDCEESKILSQ